MLHIRYRKHSIWNSLIFPRQIFLGPFFLISRSREGLVGTHLKRKLKYTCKKYLGAKCLVLSRYKLIKVPVYFTSSSLCMYTGSLMSMPANVSSSSALGSTKVLINRRNFSLQWATTTSVPQITSWGPEWESDVMSLVRRVPSYCIKRNTSGIIIKNK